MGFLCKTTSPRGGKCAGGKAACKLMLVLLVLFAAIWGLSELIDEEVLHQLKQRLSVGAIVALVVLINLVSFACFLAMFAAYRWIRRDLRPSQRDELPE